MDFFPGNDSDADVFANPDYDGGLENSSSSSNSERINWLVSHLAVHERSGIVRKLSRWVKPNIKAHPQYNTL